MNNKLKRFVVLALCFILLLAPAVAFADNGSTTVYITRTGEKYHNSGCSYLKSSIPISLEEAVEEGYTRCSRCHPPILDQTSTPRPTVRAQYTPRPTIYVQSTPQPTARIYTAPKTVQATSQSAKTSSGNNVIWILSTVTFAILSAISFANASDQKRIRKGLETQRTLQISKNIMLESENKKLSSEVSRLKKENIELVERIKGFSVALMRQTNESNEARYFKFEKFLTDESMRTVCHVPHGAFIGEDGLPAGHGSRKWGDYFTFYSSQNGTRYHDNYGCSGAYIPINALNVGELTPCGRCKPVLPDLNWYFKLKKMQELKQEFGEK